MLPKTHKINNPGSLVVLQDAIVLIFHSFLTTTYNQQYKKCIFLCAKSIPANYLLVTINLKSLNVNIPNSEGISQVKEVYESYPEKTVGTKVIITYLVLILALTNFMFNCKSNLKIRGCIMRTACDQVMQTFI